jgi:heterodisulfide reductase subunit D
MDAGKLKFNHALSKKVTYHDPCHLGRHCGLYQPPREVLKRIPGIELVEMERVKENSRCCGAGGGLKAGFPELQAQISVTRVKEAERTGADFLVSTCPFCYQGLQLGINAAESSLKMCDLTELVVEAQGKGVGHDQPISS